MTFESHKIVKEYMSELEKITQTRDVLRQRLAEVWEMSFRTDDDEERQVHVKSAKDLEQQVQSLTTRGNHYMLKIDQLNGVR